MGNFRISYLVSHVPISNFAYIGKQIFCKSKIARLDLSKCYQTIHTDMIFIPISKMERWGCPDGGQAWIDGQKGSSVCLVGLAGNHPRWAAPLWPNAQFGPVLPTTGPLECSTHAEEADQQRPNCLPSGQRQATHIFGDAPEAPGARMGGSFASTV